jgi:hypothetical protein
VSTRTITPPSACRRTDVPAGAARRAHAAPSRGAREDDRRRHDERAPRVQDAPSRYLSLRRTPLAPRPATSHRYEASFSYRRLCHMYMAMVLAPRRRFTLNSAWRQDRYEQRAVPAATRRPTQRHQAGMGRARRRGDREASLRTRCRLRVGRGRQLRPYQQ